MGFRSFCRVRFLLATLGGVFAATAAVADEPAFSIAGHVSPDSYPGMTLSWREEFGGASLDHQNWTITGGENTGSLPAAVALDGGFLILPPRKSTTNRWDGDALRIDTAGKRTFRFGRIDVRAKLPPGAGFRPAIRLHGNHSTHDEITLLERGDGPVHDDTVHGELQWTVRGGHVYEGGSITLPAGVFSDQFHVFSITWDASAIRWLVDGQTYLERSLAAPEFDVFRGEFHLLVELAAEDPYSSGSLVIDYIRYFR